MDVSSYSRELIFALHSRTRCFSQPGQNVYSCRNGDSHTAETEVSVEVVWFRRGLVVIDRDFIRSGAGWQLGKLHTTSPMVAERLYTYKLGQFHSALRSYLIPKGEPPSITYEYEPTA